MSDPPIDWIARACAEKGLPDSYAVAVIGFLRELSGRILELRGQLSRTVVIGLNGGQGSGKTTLSLLLTDWLEREHDLSAACLSLDDLYYGKARRLELARSSHPLFATRGVPGTHDVALGMQILDKLTGLHADGAVRLPKFDKATDDHLEEAEWPAVQAPVDVVVFEGWCLGAVPQADDALEAPVNELEKNDDPAGRWRVAVNEHLQTDYAELFERLDMLVMLRIPSFDKAIEWRRLQESKLPDPQTEAQLARFMMYFERLTRHMLETGPAHSNLVIDINDEHELAGITPYHVLEDHEASIAEEPGAPGS
jgi:D-glycerate 3-kinase